MANSVDPDQMPHSVASDLGLRLVSVPIFRVIQIIFCVAPDKMGQKISYILEVVFLFLHNNILWILIRSTSIRCF